MAEEPITGNDPEAEQFSNEVKAPEPESTVEKVLETPQVIAVVPKKKSKSKKNQAPPVGAMGVSPENIAASDEPTSIESDTRLQVALWGNEKKKTVTSAGILAAVMLVLAISGVYFTTNGGITGFIVGEPTEHTYDYPQTYAQSTETTLAFQNILGLSITGELQGTGAVVKLRTSDGDHLVANLTGTAGETYTLTTDKKEYLLGQPVTVTLSPDTTTKSVYAAVGEENQLLDGNTFMPNATGNYTIFALVTTQNDILRLEVTVHVVDALSEAPGVPDVASATDNKGAQHTFTNLCTDSCLLQAEESNPVIVVELNEGSTLKLTALTTVERTENRAPNQLKTFGDVTIKTGESVTLDLTTYFRDPDGNPISYDTALTDGLGASITQDTLTLTGNVAGEYTSYVYASDGGNLVTGNNFKVTVGDDLTTSVSEAAQQTNPPATDNVTQPSDVIIPQPPANISFTDCNDPNPNLRPISCIEGNEADYFIAKKIYLEDAGKNKVGRMTSFGNMIIMGELVQSASGEPNNADFRVSRPSADLTNEVNMAWIDRNNGNLYLRGVLYEEQVDLVPPTTDAFLIQNTKGTTLGYFDRRTGNLYLRGNLITGKADLE